MIGPDGKETKTILFVDKGSHRSWVLNSISSTLKLKQNKIENISTRVFKKEKESTPEPTRLMELRIRGNYEGATTINLLALESNYIANTGPYTRTNFAEKLWLQNMVLADDRFDKIQSEEEEPSGILIEMDQFNPTQ